MPVFRVSIKPSGLPHVAVGPDKAFHDGKVNPVRVACLTVVENHALGDYASPDRLCVRWLDHGADAGGHRVDGEWLGQDRHARYEMLVFENLIRGVAGGERHLQVGPGDTTHIVHVSAVSARETD